MFTSFASSTLAQGRRKFRSAQTINFQNYINAVLRDNPIGFWLLDETSGSTANDRSTQSINATYYNTPTLNQTGPGAIDKSVFFDAASSESAYTGTTSVYNLTSSNNWSAEIWVKDNTTNNANIENLFVVRADDTQTIHAPVAIALNNSVAGRVQVFTADSAGSNLIITHDAAADTNWHHIAVTAASGGALRLYRDGVEVASTTTSRWASSTLNKRAVIGANWNVSTPFQYCTLNLAGAAFYNSTLSAERVLAHYNSGSQ